MVIATDTRFLFSLYGADCHTSVAKAWSSSNSSPIHSHFLARFEMLNSFRFAECRKFIPPDTALNYSVRFESDASKRLHREIHVDFAKIIDATHLLTFDANQKELAESEGLIVPF